MKVIFIDYSEIYYQDAAKTAVPDRRSGKFVQIRSNDTEYLVFSPKELTPYHAGLVERFCTEKGLKGSYDDKNKSFVVHEPDWVVVGGGKFEIDETEKHIRLYDNSMAYGRFDSKGLKEKIHSISGMSEYKVLIE
jgi:Janus/Ocnus family (Ocnus)